MRHLRLILLGLFLLVCLVLVQIPAVHSALTQWTSLEQKLKGYGWAAGPVFAGIVAALVVVGVPRLPLCAFAGLAFGFLLGLLWAEVSTLIGALATFCFVRWTGRETIMSRWPALERYARRLGKGGWRTVFLVRIMPVSALLADAALALTPVTRVEFLLASAVGLLPEAIPATLVGAGIGRQAPLQSMMCFLTGALLLGVGGYLVVKWRHQIGGRQDVGPTAPMANCAENDNAA